VGVPAAENLALLVRASGRIGCTRIGVLNAPTSTAQPTWALWLARKAAKRADIGLLSRRLFRSGGRDSPGRLRKCTQDSHIQVFGATWIWPIPCSN
jgi:hypothetical protein